MTQSKWMNRRRLINRARKVYRRKEKRKRKTLSTRRAAKIGGSPQDGHHVIGQGPEAFFLSCSAFAAVTIFSQPSSALAHARCRQGKLQKRLHCNHFRLLNDLMASASCNWEARHDSLGSSGEYREGWLGDVPLPSPLALYLRQNL